MIDFSFCHNYWQRYTVIPVSTVGGPFAFFSQTVNAIGKLVAAFNVQVELKTDMNRLLIRLNHNATLLVAL